MARIKGLEVHEVMEGVEVWQFGTAHIPLQQALDGELVGVTGPVALGRARPGRWGRRSIRELRVAALDMEGLGRIRGIVVSRSVTRLTRYLLRAARPTRGTALGTWLQGRDLDEASMAELGELLERAWLLGQDVQGTPLGRRLPKGGVALLPDTAELRLVRVTLEGRDWWLDRIHEATDVCAAVLDRFVGIGGHRVPQPLQLRRHGPAPLYGWFDGLRSGHVPSLDVLAPALRARFDDGAWMRAVREPLRPLADLEVRFLVRQPPLDDRPRVAASVLPPGCEHPAILVPSIEPIPLVDAGQRPLDVPVIDDAAEALAVLGRAYQGRIFVPHAHCLAPIDVSCHRSRAAWLVGVLPRCLAD